MLQATVRMDGQKMLELLDKYVKLVGEANVVQVVSESASANIIADKNYFFLDH